MRARGLVTSPARPRARSDGRLRSQVLAEHTPGRAPGAVGAGTLVAGRFRLDDLLSDHAGARSWRATDLTLARNVAVHVVPADDPRATAALTAARTSATVSDGRVLRVLDALEEDDHVSIVHEWGSGLSLDRLVAHETLPARRAAWLVREVAEAIAVAHRHGVAHGRLLPENVMVNDAGAVKVAGFVVDGVLLGRTRATSGEDGRPAVPTLSDHEADVRNLGGLLYAALTGRWPGSPESVLPAAPSAERGLVCRPRQVRSGVPRALDLLCDRVLNAPEHGARAVESATQVGEALSAWLGEPVAGAAVTSASALLGDELHPWEGPDLRVDADPEDTQAWQAPADEGTEEVPVGTGHPGHASHAAHAAPVASRTATPSPTPSPIAFAAPVTAPAAPTRATPHAAPAPSTNSGVPVHWGPDRPDDPPARSSEPPSGGVPWLRLAAVLAALTLAVLAVVVAFDLGSTPSGDPDGEPTAGATSPSSSPSRPLPVTVASFDPDDQSGGPPEENQ